MDYLITVNSAVGKIKYLVKNCESPEAATEKLKNEVRLPFQIISVTPLANDVHFIG
jgi:hypothetical protein